MKNNVTKMLAVLALIAVTAVASVAGTLAYLTDRESKANVFTVGDVTIELEENFHQGSELLPGVTVEKEATVTNTGKNNAWVWMTVAVPTALGDAENTILNLTTGEGNDWTKVAATTTATIDEKEYVVYTLLHNEAVEPGVKTAAGLTAVTMNSHVDIDPEGNMHWVENGETTAFDWNVNEDGKPVVYVSAYAIQTAGFETIEAAYAAYYEQWGENGFATEANLFVAESDDDGAAALEALANGTDIYATEDVDMINLAASEVDGQGATVTMAGTGDGAFGYLAFAPGKNVDTTVSNVNVVGSGFVEVGHYGQGGGNYTVNNLTITDFESTLCVADGANKVAAAFAHYGTATLNDCVMTGTTAAKDGYNAYDAGFINGTTTVINGGEYGSMYLWSQAKVTLNNVKVGVIDSAAITTRNLGKLTIGAGTVVDTIKIVCENKYTPALVIEDGAVVGEIVYKGVTYTQEEWLAR